MSIVLKAEQAATAVTVARTPDRYQRVTRWATGASRRLELQALADCAYATAVRAVEALFEELPGVGRINLHADGRARIPLPWAKHADQWGLTRAQRELVRALLFAAIRQHEKGSGPAPLFVFDAGRRCWLVNLVDYPTRTAAGAWCEWARQNWTPATMETALQYLATHSPNGRKRGTQAGTGEGARRALG